MRDPRRLGAERVRVQIALGDLADPPSFRNALRGVDTVVHLAASIRDQPQRLDRGAQRHRHLADGRGGRARGRRALRVLLRARRLDPQPRALLRAKALAEQAVREAELRSTCSRPSIVYAPGDPWLTLLERLALLPVMPVSGRGPRRFPADLGRGRRRLRDGRAARGDGADADTPATSSPGPRRSATTRSSRSCCARCDRRRPLLHVPTPLVSRALRAARGAAGPRAFATWDEAELMEVSMISAARHRRRRSGSGVSPQRDARASLRRERLRARLAQRHGVRAAALRPTAAAASSCGGEREQRPLAGRAPDELDAQRQPVLALEQRQRDRRLAGRVEDGRERREQARARERAPSGRARRCRACRAAAGARRAPA